ncbi:putative DNA-directed RNA polymerase, partial [Dichanthelium oligosanthes]
LEKNIQASNFEVYIMKIAEAFSGYKFYLPAFLDFRGRNYRYGPFHFHECDLVRSLILFAECDDSPAHTKNNDTTNPDLNSIIVRNFGISSAFHLRKCKSYNDAIEIWDSQTSYMEDPSFISGDIFKHVNRARHPFQYLSACVTWVVTLKYETDGLHAIHAYFPRCLSKCISDIELPFVGC